jgi:hypothetical protein
VNQLLFVLRGRDAALGALAKNTQSIRKQEVGGKLKQLINQQQDNANELSVPAQRAALDQ